MNDKPGKKRKGVALKADVVEDKEQEIEDINENLSNSIVLLAK